MKTGFSGFYIDPAHSRGVKKTNKTPASLAKTAEEMAAQLKKLSGDVVDEVGKYRSGRATTRVKDGFMEYLKTLIK